MRDASDRGAMAVGTGQGRANRAVAAWLWLLVGLVMAMTAVGGATRLTGSGLSITEWRPVTGAIPPLTDAAWQAEFAKYRGSSQYMNQNAGMALDEFRSIYWWEWGHRQLGRLIGLAFFLPLLVFWWRGAVGSRRAVALLGIGALGGLQAGIGWIMVASGLEPGMVAVAPVKLALHLLVATLILALLVAAASAFGSRRAEGGEGRGASAALVGLIVCQIGLGGLVAGSKAGLTYNTWPLMDGRLVPGRDALFAATPWFENFVDNPALVQFDHRLAGYAVVLLAGWTAWRVRRALPGSAAAFRATVVAGLALAQAALGIATLLLAVPLLAGLAHQLLAMTLLCAATRALCLSGRPRPRRRPLPVSRAPALAPGGAPR